ncbi:MAG: hypothetical protein PSV13_07830 [Lacunisphaera sp.]|nr:hypothetical protein [Lacunisphaera sp.]
MNLEKALQIVDAKCDVELPALKRIFHDATQRKYGERAARNLLLSGATLGIVKDEYNRLLVEKGAQYLQQYSVVLPATEIADYPELEASLQEHFRRKMDFIYSEACHQLNTAETNLQMTGSGIHLEPDYRNSLRGWNADIQTLVAYLEKSQMKPQPNITYNFHGHNARVTTGGVDASVNVVNLSEGQLFNDLRKLLEAVPDAATRQQLVDETNALEAKKDKPGRMAGYLKFIEHAANHVCLISPLLPALAQWAQQ